MFLLVVGAGRVGSAVAKAALAAGHEVSVLDEDPLSHERLDVGEEGTWEDRGGLFTVGTALEIDALLEAGVDHADVFVAATDGDNTNILIGQVAQKRFDIGCVVIRILDPARADFYSARGLRVVCPTKTAIDTLMEAVRSCAIPPARVTG